MSRYQTKKQILRDFARMFSVMNMTTARRWWSERGLRESCECGVVNADAASVLSNPTFLDLSFPLF